MSKHIPQVCIGKELYITKYNETFFALERENESIGVSLIVDNNINSILDYAEKELGIDLTKENIERRFRNLENESINQELDEPEV